MVTEEEKANGQGQRALAVPDSGFQGQITKFSNLNIALKGVQRAQNIVACSFEPLKK